MFLKCLLCFVFVMLRIECVQFVDESCTTDNGPGTCKQLSKCSHLLNEIQRSGTPMPTHMREKLQRLGCGFESDEPLVCCTFSNTNKNTPKPFTSKPSTASWGSNGNQNPYNTDGNDRNNNNNRDRDNNNKNNWGSNTDSNRDRDSNNNNWGTNTNSNSRDRDKNNNNWGSNTNSNRDKDNNNNNWGSNTSNNKDRDKNNNNNNWGSNTNSVDNSIERIPDIRNHRNFNLLPTECGAIESERIFGGSRTKLFEMPWMVLLSYDSGRGTRLSCGGTLITEWYVLTAAHCISFLSRSLKLKSAILGEYDVRRDPDCERMEGQLVCAPKIRNVSIDTVIPHPQYSPQTLADDIGLIRLAEPADFSLDSMKPICLPTTRELASENLEGVNGVVAGWGATEDGLQSPVLLSVDLPIISNEECQGIYRDGSVTIHKSQLCAGGVPDKDSCGGDSGGPLVYPGRPGAAGVRYVQRGIVSYGSKRCGVGGFPGVYTRVANYMDWILDNIRG